MSVPLLFRYKKNLLQGFQRTAVFLAPLFFRRSVRRSSYSHHSRWQRSSSLMVRSLGHVTRRRSLSLIYLRDEDRVHAMGRSRPFPDLLLSFKNHA